ncbi:hypothetical protein Hanom_Chr16g01493331 [Helianthus anomalus]
MRFIVALLIASLFIDKADSELSFIPRPNLYPCASYSPGVRSQKYSHPCPHVNPTSLLSILIQSRLHRLCGPPSIPLSFILANVLPRRDT